MKTQIAIDRVIAELKLAKTQEERALGNRINGLKEVSIVLLIEKSQAKTLTIDRNLYLAWKHLNKGLFNK